TLSTGLLQPSDDLTSNPLAQAYIKPAYDVDSSAKVAPFIRNASTPLITNPDGTTTEDTSKPVGSLCKGRDQVSGPGFWTVYLQGAFQGDELRDRDPDEEAPNRLGSTYHYTSGGVFVGSVGSLIYLETLRDASWQNGQALAEICLNTTVTHETG